MIQVPNKYKFIQKIQSPIGKIRHWLLFRSISAISAIRNFSLKTPLIIILAGIVLVATLTPNNSIASSQINTTKSTTADFNQGTTNNLNTAGDEMKMVPNPQTAWYQTGGTWNYRKKIVIDHTKVPNTDQTDFPVLINLASDADLASKAQDDGDDILITQDDQTSKLSHEIESFDGNTGALVLWVKIPSLSHTYDTTVYMYYGNAAATSQQSATAVWSNGYAGVWHFNQSSWNGTAGESPSSINNYPMAAKNGAQVAPGKFGNGASTLIANDSYMEAPYNIFDASSGDWSISIWAKVDVSAGGYGNIFARANYSAIYINQALSLIADHYPVVFGGGGISQNTWTQLVLQRRGNVYELLKNGDVVGTQTNDSMGSPGGSFNIGGHGSGDDTTGVYDEARITPGVTRSADWYKTEYANQNAPASFYSLQPEVAKTSVNIASNNISADWYTINSTEQTAWKYRRQITIDHTKVPNTDQSEFPMLVKITDATDPIFSKAQADGDDILFTNTSGNVKLAHELETFNATAGSRALWAWVKIPVLKTATDTVIWLYYGNPSCASQQAVASVWSNGYYASYHLNQTPTVGSATMLDSTSSARNGTPFGTVSGDLIDGKISKAINFDATNNRIDLGFTNNGFLNDFSVSFWVNPRNTQVDYSDIFGNHVGADGIVMQQTGGTNQYAGPASTILFTLAANTWQKVTYTRSSTAGAVAYVDSSAPVSDPTATATMTNNAGYNMQIGQGYAGNWEGSRYFNGYIDDFKISTSVRSADWIATEYANQNAPETFASISKESAYYPVAGTAGWYATGGTWTARQTVTLDHTKVPNTDQTDFPVLVKITNQSNGVFASAQADGDDILFTSSNGTTKLSHEIETYTTTAGSKALWAWVKVPTLSHTVDTVLYLYYGNASCSSQQSATAVWSNGYAGVWHMGEASGSNLSDSTGHGYTAIKSGSPTQADGRISKAQYFGSGNSFAVSTFPALGNEYTVQAWTNYFNDGWDAQSILGSSVWGELSLNYRAGGVVQYIAGPNLITTGSTSGISKIDVTRNAGGDGAVYLNGANPTTGTLAALAATDVYFGTGWQPFKSWTDEVRILNVARSADWIATEYANQNSPETFESFSSEQSSNYYASPTGTAGGSGIINTIWNGGWGTPIGFASNVQIPSSTSIKYQIRSSAVGGSTDGDWTAWADLGTATSTGTYSVATAGMPAITLGTNKYLQVRSDFISTDGSATPILSDYTIYYLSDTQAPTNPTTVTATVGGSAVTSGTWINTSGAFNFVFSGASDGGGGESGVAGYYVYLGTNASADPEVDGAYQAHVGAIGDNQTYTATGAVDGSHYYFRVKTKDVAGNVSAAATLFDLGFDTTLPTRPTFVAADPAGYTTTNSFTLSGPVGK